MSNFIKISAIQSAIDWQNADSNLAKFETLIQSIEETNLIILPEMFNSGFSMNPKEIAETMDGKTISWMKNIAVKKKAAIMGSIAIKEKGEFYNRLIFVYPNGDISSYNKKHLFILSDEHKNYKAGNELLIIDYLGWKLKPLICYDLRFPVWARNTEDYDILVYIANWPNVRRLQWLSLLQARAIENQSFVIGLNRTGEDGNNYTYSGDSIVINPIGQTIYNFENRNEVKTICLDKKVLDKAKKHFPVLNDRDNFEIK